MKEFHGEALRWEWRDGVVEITLDREPLNEIGTVMLADLEKFARAIRSLAPMTAACIITSARPGGFCAGADLKELYHGALPLSKVKREEGVRKFLQRIHAVLNAIDEAPFVTFAAAHGLCLGGGLELALACDQIVADKMARFGFPELRLGLIPGFGGIPRLRRDVGNSFIRDLLFTGRTVKAVIPGGSSCPVLKADEVDVPMDFDSLAKIGSMLGSGGVVIIDEDTCMVKVALRIMKFYAHESCGWCIPCREG